MNERLVSSYKKAKEVVRQRVQHVQLFFQHPKARREGLEYLREGLESFLLPDHTLQPAVQTHLMVVYPRKELGEVIHLGNTEIIRNRNHTNIYIRRLSKTGDGASLQYRAYPSGKQKIIYMTKYGGLSFKTDLFKPHLRAHEARSYGIHIFEQTATIFEALKQPPIVTKEQQKTPLERTATSALNTPSLFPSSSSKKPTLATAFAKRTSLSSA